MNQVSQTARLGYAPGGAAKGDRIGRTCAAGQAHARCHSPSPSTRHRRPPLDSRPATHPVLRNGAEQLRRTRERLQASADRRHDDADVDEHGVGEGGRGDDELVVLEGGVRHDRPEQPRGEDVDRGAREYGCHRASRDGAAGVRQHRRAVRACHDAGDRGEEEGHQGHKVWDNPRFGILLVGAARVVVELAILGLQAAVGGGGG